jgi:hypothetical protein
MSRPPCEGRHLDSCHDKHFSGKSLFTLMNAIAIVESRQHEYHELWPHGTLGHRTPTQVAANVKLKGNGKPFGVGRYSRVRADPPTRGLNDAETTRSVERSVPCVESLSGQLVCRALKPCVEISPQRPAVPAAEAKRGGGLHDTGRSGGLRLSQSSERPPLCLDELPKQLFADTRKLAAASHGQPWAPGLRRWMGEHGQPFTPSG